MSIDIGRYNLTILRRRGSLRAFRASKSNGPYGSFSAKATLLGRTFWLIRRYPDDRLRCPKCGYRRNDAA